MASYNSRQTVWKYWMLIGIGPETGTNRELNSGDKPIGLHSLVRVFPIYRWDYTYKDKLIFHR